MGRPRSRRPTSTRRSSGCKRAGRRTPWGSEIDTIPFILLAALSGIFVGGLARLLIPGPDPMSLLETLLVGLAGSLIAAVISHYAFDREGAPGLLLSVICAALLVFAIRKVRDRAVPAHSQQPGGLGGFGSTSPMMGGGVRFMPGCLIFSLLASVGLTILLNLLIRAF